MGVRKAKIAVWKNTFEALFFTGYHFFKIVLTHMLVINNISVVLSKQYPVWMRRMMGRLFG